MSKSVATRNEFRERVAEELRALLARRRTSASALAAQLGVSYMYVTRRLTGETAIDTDDLARWGEILNITPLEIIRAASSTTTIRESDRAGWPVWAPTQPTGRATLVRGRAPETVRSSRSIRTSRRVAA